MAVKYCAYCGAKMTMSARFCSQCGKAVENIPEDELDGKAGSQEIKTTEMTAKPVKGKKTTALKHHIDFCGRKLEFDAAIVPYNSLRRSFMDYSDNMKEEFISYYKSNVHNFNDMYDRGLQTFLEKGKEAFDFSVSVLETYGIHTSAEAVFQRTPDHSAIAAVVEHYSDIADQFIDFAQQLSAYRASNRARQFRMQGGGFGITGGIKGALIAGAFNLGMDGLRSARNAVVDSHDRAQLREIEKKVYKSEDHGQFMADMLESWCKYELFQTIESILIEDGKLAEPKLNSAKAVEPIMKAEEIIEKARAPISDADSKKAIDLICTGLQYDPYNFVYAYGILYKLPGTDKQEILNFTREFAIEQEYLKKLADIHAEMLAPILAMSEKTVGAIDKKMASIDELEKEIPELNLSDTKDKLKKKKQKLQEQEAEKKRQEEERKKAEEREKQLESQIKELTKGAEENIAKVKSLIDKYDYDTLWEMAEQGNAYAQFRLNRLYDPKHNTRRVYDSAVKVYRIKVDSRADAPYVDEVLNTYSSKGYLFAQFLQIFYPYRENVWATSKPTPEILEGAKIIYSLSKKGVIPAMAACGIMKKTFRDAIGLSDEESLKFLLAAADAFDEDAILELNKRTYVDKTHTVPSWPISEEQYNHYRELYRYAIAPRYGYSPTASSQKAPSHSTSSSSSSGSGCYITSAVCRTFGKPDDCYELTAFRKFRDEWLAEQPGGKELIQEYYQTAPLIVKRIDEREDSREIYQTIWTDYLKKCLSDIENGAFSQCKEMYMAMVNSLKRWFCCDNA